MSSSPLTAPTTSTASATKVLCVSGLNFLVPTAALNASESTLRNLVSDSEAAPWAVRNAEGAYVIDRPSMPFPYILNYLLFGAIPGSYRECREIIQEVDFYCLTQMKEKMLAAFPLLNQPYELDTTYVYGLNLCNTSHMPMALRFHDSGRVSILERDSVMRHGDGCYMWMPAGMGWVRCDPTSSRVTVEWIGTDGVSMQGTMYTSQRTNGLLFETDTQIYRLVKWKRPIAEMEECFTDDSKRFK